MVGIRIIFILALLSIANTIEAYQKSGADYQVTLQLKWKHQFQFAGYYAAIEQGFYKDAGINVTLLEPIKERNAIEQVATGHADFGISNTDIIIERANGKKLVVLASIFQHSPLVLIASKASGIKYVHDLVGKRIGLEEHAADIITFMKDEGVALDDCHVDKHEYNIDNLLHGEIDAITAYSTDETFVLSQAGFEYNMLSPIMGGIDFYGDVLFTSEKLLSENPDLVVKFRQASLQGWEYALNNPTEIIELIHSKYSTRHSKAHLFFEANQMKPLILPHVVELGYSNKGRWEQIIKTYDRAGMLAKPIPIDGLLFEDYLSESKKFNWKLFLIYSLTIVSLLIIAYTYYRAYKKVKKEIAAKLKAQQELIKSEKQLRKEKETKDKVYAIIAHDLKAPLALIIGFSNVLLKSINKASIDEILDDLNTIKKTSQRAYELLNNLLQWSSFQIGNIEFKSEKIELLDFCEHLLEEIRELAKPKNINIALVSKENYHVNADKNMLTVILRNLLTNAIKFSFQNSKVELILEEGGNRILVTVKDYGKGIPEENIKKLFKLNRSVVTEGTQNEKGSGLGLLVSSDFAKKHGGELRVFSVETKGSKFSFSLPKAK